MSSSLRAYEIQTFAGGKWKIDSVFDDKDLALFEAGRMDESGRHAGIRVVEEEFDELTEKTRVRTIFRGSKIEQANMAALERNKQARQQVAQQKVQFAQEKVMREVEAIREQRARKTNPYRLVGLFAAITLLGVGAVIGLRFLYGMI